MRHLTRKTVFLAFAATAILSIPFSVRLGRATSAAAADARAAAPASGATATAILTVDPANKGNGQGADAVWQREIATQATLLKDPSTLRRAVASDEVRKTHWFSQFKDADGPTATARAAEALQRALAVNVPPGTSLISVTVTAEPAGDAAVLANAVGDAAIGRNQGSARDAMTKQSDLLVRQQKLIAIELDDVQKQLRDKELQLGMDQVGKSPDWNGKQRQLDRALGELWAVNMELVAAQLAVEDLTAAKERGAVPAAVDAEAAAAPQVAALRAELVRTRLALAEAEPPTTQPAGANPATPEAARLARREAACRRLLDEAVQDARKSALAAYTETVNARVERARQRSDVLAATIDKISKDLGRLNEIVADYQTLRQRGQELRAAKSALISEADRLQQQAASPDAAGLRYVEQAAAG